MSRECDKIQGLLESRLNTVSSGFDTAFENMKFTPAIGTPWQEVKVLWGKTSNPSSDSNFERALGIMQVTLHYPTNAGRQAAQSRVKTILDAFRRGLALLDGTLRVLIDESPWPGPSANDGVWFTVPISIPFIADVHG